MPRKAIPAEALVDLRRRLSALPPRSPKRRSLMQATAALYGVSEPTLYRMLEHQVRPRALQRADTTASPEYCLKRSWSATVN